MNLKISESLLLSIENNTNTLIEQTKTRPKGTMEFKLNISQATFPFISFLKIEGNLRLLVVTSLKVYKVLFNKIEGNNIFSIYISVH